MHQVTFFLFLFSFSVGDAFKVLFFCPVPAHSHQKMYKELWTKLSLKGHQVFVVTPLPDFNQSLTNLTEYDISSVEEFEDNQIKPEWKMAFYKKPTFLGTIIRQFIIQKVAGDGMDFLYNHPEVQRLVKEHDSFDGCVFEWFHPAVAVYSHLFHCPMIGLGSNTLPIQMLDTVGNPSHPIVAPEQDLPVLRDRITFFQRVWSTFWSVFVRWHQQYFLIPAEDARIRKYYGEDVPYLGDLQRNISLVILNRNPAFHRPIPINPNVIEIGYLNYQKPETKVDSKLQKFLDESQEGVVYFSLGISMEGTSMPAQYLTQLQAIFRDLPYKVVWKWENSTMTDKPSNVFIAKFLPQVYVLVGSTMSQKQLSVLVLLVTVVSASKILFLSCTPAPSHQKPFQQLWRALSLKGHEVHVLTPNPLNDSTLTNLTEYDLSDFYVLLAQTEGSIRFLTQKPGLWSVFIKDIKATELFSVRLYNRTLHHPETRRLLDNNESFDVVIVEWLFPTLASFAAHYGAPLIGITSLGAPLVALDALSNPSHPVVNPDMNLPLKVNLDFMERLVSVLYSVYVRLYYKLVVLPREDVNVRGLFKEDLPYLGEVEKNVSVLLMNRNPAFHRPLPLFPNTVELGRIEYPVSKTPLEDGLKSLLDQATEGVVYFSLGSNVKSIYLSHNAIKILQDTFASLPYKVVWKWENDTMEGKPDNVVITKWVSQVSLLEHPNVKLFITQGGLQSTEEAIAAHKPIIGIPFHSDQTTNVDTCVQYGMGKMLDLEELYKLSKYILEIIDDPSYAANAKKLDQLLRDQPQDGVEKAIWWIEYVIRHKGAKHLRSIAVDLPLWQYLMLDVLAFVLLIATSFLLLIYFVVKSIFRLVFGRKVSKSKRE